MAHDIQDERWRFHCQRHHDGHSVQWVMESDTRCCMAIMELPYISKWYRDSHPNWREEWDADAAEIQANANLIQSAPFLLRALLAARSGDMSLVQEAIERAAGVRDWRGEFNSPQPPQHK